MNYSEPSTQAIEVHLERTVIDLIRRTARVAFHQALVISPWISQEYVEFLGHLSRAGTDVHVLTSDWGRVSLFEHQSGIRIRVGPVHAKLFIGVMSDNSRFAVMGSENHTRRTRKEINLLIRDPQVISGLIAAFSRIREWTA